MTRRRWSQFMLLARTLARLRPAQIAHRARLLATRAAIARFPAFSAGRLRQPCPDRPGWPQGFLPIDGRLAAGLPSAPANAEGRFRFLEEERDLGRPFDWHQAGADRLWGYHLHYFEWAWAFADQADRTWASERFRELWRSWRASSPLGVGDAWSPYVASLRAWVLCGLYGPLVDGTPDEDAYLDDLTLHAGFVRATLELDVGGNHLVKNLKALVGLGVFLDDAALLQPATERLGRQLQSQVLDDGGHFERSPSYHCQVLGDLLDVGEILAAAGRAPVHGLDDAIAAMRSWLGVMLLPDGDVPLFNDCTLVGLHRLKLLQPSPPPSGPLVVLEPSGYAVMRPGHHLHLVADVGPPCPSELPAHAHADCLSFELAVDGRRVLVDSGTSTYEAGGRRDHERSTAAHNTVEVDGEDQTEVWGAFRAARRAVPSLELATEHNGVVHVTASHDGYVRLPGAPIHRRTWRVGPGQVEITDEVSGAGRHRLVARLHVAPGIDAVGDGPGRFRLGQVEAAVGGGDGALEPTSVAQGFGPTSPTHALAVAGEGLLPHTFVTTITVGSGER